MSVGRMGLVQAGSPDKQCPTLAELTADATATASQIAEGATAYVQGQKITGTMPTTIDVAALGIKFGFSTFETVPSFFDFSSVTVATSMFQSCSNLAGIENLDFSSVTDATSMFQSCSNLAGIENLDFSSVTDAKNMFVFCNSLIYFNIEQTKNIKNTVQMFYECISLTSIFKFDFSSVGNALNMFKKCTNLTTIGNIIFLNTSLSLADSPNLDKDTLILFGTIASGPGESGLAALKTLGLPAQTITFNTAAQEFLESEGIVAKLTDENWTVNFAESM